MARTSQRPEESAFKILVSKYQANPKWFEKHLPDISQIIQDTVSPYRRSCFPFVLTERERELHIDALPDSEAISKLGREDAIEALQHCAYLIRDDSLPGYVRYEAFASLFNAVSGKSPGSFRKNTTILINETRDVEPAHHVSIIRGVVLNLDTEMRLVSITVTPRKFRERKKMMSIVGIGRDPKSDVARRHDDYLAEQSPHGPC